LIDINIDKEIMNSYIIKT